VPRLFLKLFGTFWLTTVLILTISIFVSFHLARDSMAARLADPREVDAALREVVATGGLDALRAWVADEGNFLPGQTVYVVDDTGRELLGRPVTPYLESRLERIWHVIDELARKGRSYDDRYRGFTPVLETADGSRWLAIPGPTAPPPFGVLSYGLRWVVLAAAAATSLLTFWLLSRSLTRPAQRIADTVKRFAAGDMSARVGSAGSSRDEIGNIARQFDSMASQLEAQFDMRRELFRNVSHELRAPLARLQIATELLERKPEQPEKQLARIRSEIGVLDALTAQVLALASAMQSDCTRGRVRLAGVLERVVDNAQLEAGEKGVSIDHVTPDGAIAVIADENLLASAIENVLRNAVQAAPSGGRVTVATQVSADECTVTVTDDGGGVPGDEVERIFEPFYRLDTNRDGSGIGLAITARVMQQIGGSVVARNAEGGGLAVSMTMPLASAGPETVAS